MPRIKLGTLPTPLVEAPRLSAALGGPRIFIKRDDLTGLGLGGNKVRKLEFIMADAKAKGADILITTGGSQSNFALQMTAAARRLGMDVLLILTRGVHPEMQGNQLLNHLLNAEVRIIEEGLDDLDKVYEILNEAAEELRRKGRKPYVIPIGGFTPLGTAGYFNAALEIKQQLEEQKVDVQYIFMADGSGGTHTGLMVGRKYLGMSWQLIGISVLYSRDRLKAMIAEQANNLAELLGAGLNFSPDEVIVSDEYIGQGYGMLTEACIEAIRLVAQTEGIFLDPVYTGKAMSGLIDFIRKGKISAEDTVIFMHTGGQAALFAYAGELAK